MAINFPTYNGIEVFVLPPPGYEVDFDHPRREKVLEHILIFGLMAPLAFVCLIQRYYCKIFLSKGLQIDDYFIFLGWIASIATQGLMTTTLSKGTFCIHSYEMPLKGYEHYAFYAFLTAPIYMLTNSFIKLSLLTFYLQISPQKWFRVSIWSTIAFVCVSTLVIVGFMLFGCSPIYKAWSLKTEGTCVNGAIFYIATAAANIFTDCVLFVLPIPMLCQLHMPLAQKVGAMIIFSIGSVTVATSVVRLALLIIVLDSTDKSWDGCPANIWTFIEGNLFIICASTPTLRKFFKHFMPRLMRSSAGGSTTTYITGESATAPSKDRSRFRHGRKSYVRFSRDEEAELETFHTIGGTSGSAPRVEGLTRVAVASSTDGNLDAEGIEDDHSDRAILQSNGFGVAYR